ncbi:hypothetical protein PRK78_001850 [Emydomyces testavorans]|uniref:Cytochrome P450 monooxygenase n=1 Tax=Emydomyces testavorans TaxID=2070801 RepID=A0AAF0DFA1_9EURO|nr:hypothetical protein PRK78_001850 [Emydomyces testavorans]
MMLADLQEPPFRWVLLLLCVAAWILYQAVRAFYWHPLARFPGPRVAALTRLYKAYVECVAQGSFVHVLEKYHERFGDIVRVGPNELHFSNPATYLEIYNPANRWDKEESLYHSFGEDRSSFGFLTYREAKERKDVLNRMLSRKAILGSQGIIQEKLLKAQIKDMTDDPSKLEKLPHSRTVYHELLRPEAYKSGQVPCPGSLYEEAQALMFGGADTTGTTLMHGTFYILKLPHVYQRLKEELHSAWPNFNTLPDLTDLEKLPYLTAVLKESLRISPGVASALPRVVPPSGTKLSGHFIPGGTVVGMSSHFVHRNEAVFDKPNEFIPERWLGEEGKQLDKWLFSFSYGPRSCVGQNLAWAELYFCFAHLYRKFDVTIDPSSPSELKWRDRFLPEYLGPHLKAKITPVIA